MTIANASTYILWNVKGRVNNHKLPRHGRGTDNTDTRRPHVQSLEPREAEQGHQWLRQVLSQRGPEGDVLVVHGWEGLSHSVTVDEVGPRNQVGQALGAKDALLCGGRSGSRHVMSCHVMSCHVGALSVLFPLQFTILSSLLYSSFIAPWSPP